MNKSQCSHKDESVERTRKKSVDEKAFNVNPSVATNPSLASKGGLDTIKEDIESNEKDKEFKVE